MCVCVCVRACVCVSVRVCGYDGQAVGAALSLRPPATAAPAPSLSPRGSAVTFALVALAGVCTYINVICINVIGALFPLQGLQPDTGVIIWKRGGEEETSVELIILTRATGEEREERVGGIDSKNRGGGDRMTRLASSYCGTNENRVIVMQHG